MTDVMKARGMIRLACRCQLGFDPTQPELDAERMMRQVFDCGTHGDQEASEISAQIHGYFLILPAA